MAYKMLIAASFLLASTSAVAQAGPIAEKSADQIVCELTGDCGGADPSLATQDMPETRGFSLNKRTAAKPATAPAATAPAARSAPARIVNRPAAAPARQGAPAAFTPGRTNLSIGFAMGSATLTEAGKSQARRFLTSLSDPRLSGKRFLIAGHTDAVGSRESNLELSRRRAQSMIDFLVENGADRSRFDARGFGFDQPLPGTNARNSANRRVEIVKLD